MAEAEAALAVGAAKGAAVAEQRLALVAVSLVVACGWPRRVPCLIALIVVSPVPSHPLPSSVFCPPVLAYKAELT